MKTAPEAPIVVSYATINDGLVLRWYASEAAFARGDETASASRNKPWLRDESTASPELTEAVLDVHRQLRDVYAGPFGRVDREQYEAVKSLATHRSKYLFGDELERLGE